MECALTSAQGTSRNALAPVAFDSSQMQEAVESCKDCCVVHIGPSNGRVIALHSLALLFGVTGLGEEWLPDRAALSPRSESGLKEAIFSSVNGSLSGVIETRLRQPFEDAQVAVLRQVLLGYCVHVATSVVQELILSPSKADSSCSIFESGSR